MSNGVAATPLRPFTRAVFVLGTGLTAGSGLGLFAAPGRTADYWAWTIKAPLTAALLGACYLGAATLLTLGALTREWQRARVVAVVSLTLTSLTLLVTFRNLGTFAFGDGGLTEAVAWIWFVVYLALPPLLLAAFVRQEYAGGAREYAVEAPALGATRLTLGGAGAALGLLGLGLFVEWGWLTERWPWPLPSLPAAVVGAWLCTFAAGFLWSALRERGWWRIRVAVLPAMLTLALELAAVARLHEHFLGGAATGAYLAGVVALLTALAVVAAAEERRLAAQRR